MKRQSYSFDLGILDNTITSKENLIKLNNSIWILILILINITLETIFIWTILDPISNIAIISLTILIIYSLCNLEENDLFENNKTKKLELFFLYYFYSLVISIFIKIIFIIIQREKIFNFYSNDLSLRYLSILISFFFAMRIILTFLFKKIVKDKFISEINENNL